MYHSYYHSPVGILRISADDRCISEIHFCNESELADNNLQNQDHKLLQDCTEQLIEYFQGIRRSFDFPMHQTGTPFQESVWNKLVTIPFGKTITYLDLARKLGDPKVIRAAGTANGRNKIAIAVPCHRVIGSNQEMVGYAGGIWRKRWLLAHEARIAHGVQTLF